VKSRRDSSSSETGLCMGELTPPDQADRLVANSAVQPDQTLETRLARLEAISLRSACWGSANFCTASPISTFSSLVWSTLRSISSSTLCGGISSIARP